MSAFQAGHIGVKDGCGEELERGQDAAVDHPGGDVATAAVVDLPVQGGEDALVTGVIIWVYTDQQSHRPVPISKPIRDLIATRERHLQA